MADKKISALTGATTPLAGTEVLPIVQSGATVKVAVSDLTAGRVVSATQLTSTIAIGTAPLVVTSTTNVANLNASSLNGATFAAPGAIGGGTASAITATTVNKVTITAPASASTLTIANGKTLTANNTLTLAGTDATTQTFPTTSATIARTDAAQTFTGTQSIAVISNYGVGAGATSFSSYNNSGNLGGYINNSNNQWSNAYNGGASTADTVFFIGKDSVTSRSINAGGTINASGADYAEYMFKEDTFTINKGDIVGINADGKLTNIFSKAISFVVKSTNPSYVGGDNWSDAMGVKPTDEATQDEWTTWYASINIARNVVDRIAFSGQVPVNVLGAVSGQYIIPIDENGAIKGISVSNPTFEQYQKAVGKVIAIESDGRAKIIVKVA